MDLVPMWEWSGPESERLRRRGRPVSDEGDGERGMPLPPMSPLWREHGKGMDGGGIHIVVCCCNEGEEELQVLLSTFRTDAPASCPVRVSFMLDSDGNAQTASETYELLKQALQVTADSGTESFGCVRHSGMLEKTRIPFDLYLKGPSLPVGKRNSLVIFFDDILPVKISRGEAAEPDVVYLLDADSGHPVNGLQEVDSMWRLLMVEEEAACITCPVQPVNPSESFLAASQYVEHALWDNVGESHFALQTTCRGAQCMLKYRCMVENGRLAQPPMGEGSMPPLLDSFSKTAAGIPALTLLDACPNEGLLVLLRQRGFDVRAYGLAVGVTCVPRSWLEFYAQRRRWYAGSWLAVASHLCGKESYFQTERHRWIISLYAVFSNLYLHSGVAILPALLAKGIHGIAVYIDSGGEQDEESQDGDVADGDGDGSQWLRLDWIVFGVIWGFFLLNVCVYLKRSQENLWMWINVTSVLWMLLCLATLIGSGVVVSPCIPVLVVLVPPLLAGLNSSRGMLSQWWFLAIAAMPFAMLTAVNSVLVFLYAMATLDSTEWGTRNVGSFDSGVSKSRAASMRRRKLCILFTVMPISCAVGILLMMYPSLTILPIAVGLPSAAYLLKLVLVVYCAHLERSRQRMLLGDDGARPLSLRRNISEMAPIHGRAASQYRSERHGGGGRNGGRSRMASSKHLAENGSHVTAEDGTPSPGVMDVSTPGTFFAGGSSVGDDGVGLDQADRPGHVRRGSRSPSVSSGFAGVTGIGGCSSSVAHSTRSAGSRHSRSRSRSPAAAASAPGEEVPEMPTSMGRKGDASSATGSALGAGVKIVSGLGRGSRSGAASQSATAQGSSPNVRPNRTTPRSGLRHFISKDSMSGIATSTLSRTSSRNVDMRKAWGLRQPTMESDESIRCDPTQVESSEPTLSPVGRRSSARFRQTLGFKTPSPQRAKVKTASPATTAATAAPGDAGVKRYSWSRTRPSTTDLESEAKNAQVASPSVVAAKNAILNSRVGAIYSRRGIDGEGYGGAIPGSRRPPSGGTLAGVRRTWGTSIDEGHDGLTCPLPENINAARNSRVGAVYATGIVEEDEGSESEAEFFDSLSLIPGIAANRRRLPGGGTLAGIRSSWGSSMGGSQDDMSCPLPEQINAARNMRMGAVYATGIVEEEEDDGSESESEHVDPRSLVQGISSSHGRPPSEGSLYGIRAAWGTSMGGSQDDLACPSPATINAILNSRVGAVYSRGGRDRGGGEIGCRGPTSTGSRRGRSQSGVRNDTDFVSSYRQAEVSSTAARRPRSEGCASRGGSDGRGRSARGSARDRASGERENEASGTGSEWHNRVGHAGNAAGGVRGSATGSSASDAVFAAQARRTWGAGQSSVFDSSGSSSSEGEGKPRGLRGVQVLDQIPDTDVCGSGSIIPGGGAAAGRSYSAVGGGGCPGDGTVRNPSRGPGEGVSESGFGLLPGHATTGDLAAVRGPAPHPASFRAPHVEAVKGMTGPGRGMGGRGESDFSFQEARE